MSKSPREEALKQALTVEERDRLKAYAYWRRSRLPEGDIERDRIKTIEELEESSQEEPQQPSS
jgi:hypothetical protein